MLTHIAAHISEKTKTSFVLTSDHSLSGGCINNARRLIGKVGPDEISYFVKFNDKSFLSIFEAEQEALSEIHSTQTIRVPLPICTGIAKNNAYLVLEYISLGNSSSPEKMGQQLAALHQCTSPNHLFGWHRDNVIGATPQPNSWTKDWIAFFQQHRLQFQFDLASKRGKSFVKASQLLETLPLFFQSYTPTPSLLHGDLWGGNASYDENKNPVLYDPATYYGDRETDLAFTELFGGFSSSFYQAYNKIFPLNKGYAHRKELYNLYHILNHYNLFGGSYGRQAEQMIESLITKAKSL